MPYYYHRPYQSAVFHYLRGQTRNSIEDCWNDNMAVLHSTVAFFITATEFSPRSLVMLFESWMELATTIGFDFNPIDGSFLEAAILVAGQCPVERLKVDRERNSIFHIYPLGLNRLTAAFDTLLQGRTGSVGSTQNSAIPVAYTVRCMIYQLCYEARRPSASRTSRYRGHHVCKGAMITLEFYEHVISTGIADRPDCIFDTYKGITIYDMFFRMYFEDTWDQILEEHGFDPKWVREEDKRRKRVVIGDTSTHEVRVGADASQALQVKKRRAYEHEE